MDHVAHGVWRIATFIGNLYVVRDGDDFVLVDAGTPGIEDKIDDKLDDVIGPNENLQAIVLTHGHFDHVGSAAAMAKRWGVPIYAHKLELPFTSGRSKYPPSDPTVGGFFAFASRFMQTPSYTVKEEVQALPEDGTVPFLPSWKWLPTPGHTPGHVSFFRESDKCLLAGDAVMTINLDSFVHTAMKKERVSRTAAPVTTNWRAAEASTRKIAEIEPEVLATGHGLPMRGQMMREQLYDLANRFPKPSYGRYVKEPVVTNESGVVSVPPPVADPLVPHALLAAAGMAVGAGLVLLTRLARES